MAGLQEPAEAGRTLAATVSRETHYTSTFQQVSEMEAFVDLKVAGGDLLEGPGRDGFLNPLLLIILVSHRPLWTSRRLGRLVSHRARK